MEVGIGHGRHSTQHARPRAFHIGGNGENASLHQATAECDSFGTRNRADDPYQWISHETPTMDQSQNQEPKKPRVNRKVAALLVAGTVIGSLLTQTHLALQVWEQLQQLWRSPSAIVSRGGRNDGSRPAQSVPCTDNGVSVIPERWLGDLTRQPPVLTIVIGAVNLGDRDVVIRTLTVANFLILDGHQPVEILTAIVDATPRVLGAHQSQEYHVALTLEAYLGEFSALPDASEYTGSFDLYMEGRRGNVLVEFSCRSISIIGTVHRR
jgi:hypothetical protein